MIEVNHIYVGSTVNRKEGNLEAGFWGVNLRRCIEDIWRVVYKVIWKRGFIVTLFDIQ